jgi:hypothetical protein
MFGTPGYSPQPVNNGNPVGSYNGGGNGGYSTGGNFAPYKPLGWQNAVPMGRGGMPGGYGLSQMNNSVPGYQPLPYGGGYGMPRMAEMGGAPGGYSAPPNMGNYNPLGWQNASPMGRGGMPNTGGPLPPYNPGGREPGYAPNAGAGTPGGGMVPSNPGNGGYGGSVGPGPIGNYKPLGWQGASPMGRGGMGGSGGQWR